MLVLPTKSSFFKEVLYLKDKSISVILSLSNLQPHKDSSSNEEFIFKDKDDAIFLALLLSIKLPDKSKDDKEQNCCVNDVASAYIPSCPILFDLKSNLDREICCVVITDAKYFAPSSPILQSYNDKCPIDVLVIK